MYSQSDLCIMIYDKFAKDTFVSEMLWSIVMF